MKDITDIDCSFLLRPEFELALAAAKKDGKLAGKDPLAYLHSLASDPRYINTSSELVSLGNQTGGAVVAWVGGTVAGGLLGTMLGGPIGLVGFIGMLIDGGRSARVVVINDTDSDLVLHRNLQDCGETYARPKFGTQAGRIPRRLAPIQDPSDATTNLVDGTAWYGCWGFQKATTLGIGFVGTAGAIAYNAQQSNVAPAGFTFGWDVPESGKNNCAVSVNSGDAKSVYDTWIDSKSRRSTDASTNATSGVKAYCAMESLNDNPNQANLVVVITDGKKW